jgi:hypothetical protein
MQQGCPKVARGLTCRERRSPLARSLACSGRLAVERKPQLLPEPPKFHACYFRALHPSLSRSLHLASMVTTSTAAWAISSLSVSVS